MHCFPSAMSLAASQVSATLLPSALRGMLSQQHVVVSEQGDRRLQVVWTRVGLRNRSIAARVVRVRARVEDVPDRLARDPADLGQNPLGHPRRTRVYQQHAVMTGVLSHLHSDVSERAREQVDI